MRHYSPKTERRDRKTLSDHQRISNLDPDMYWAQVDTLCQTLPETTRENRCDILRASWSQWIGGEMPGELPNYYKKRMICFYLEKAPNHLNLLFSQAGSLLAKLEWPRMQTSRMNAEKMCDHCMKKMEEYPGFHRMSEADRINCRKDLSRFLKKYTAANGLCSSQVCAFFMDHSARYEQALQGLLDKLNELEKSAQEPQPEQAEEISASAASLDPSCVVSGDEVIGLCAFLEKTASATYQRALSRLYSLHRNPDQPYFEKKAKSALQDFFSALQALEIEPIDETRLQKEFPEEYAQEMRRRDQREGTRYIMAACGWSCDGYLITNPMFYKEKREESEQT